MLQIVVLRFKFEFGFNSSDSCLYLSFRNGQMVICVYVFKIYNTGT